MIEFKDILDKDPDEGSIWARRLPNHHKFQALKYFLGVLIDKNQDSCRRIRASFVLNTLGATHSLPQAAKHQAFSAIQVLAKETDEDIRRNGLVAASSILYSLIPRLLQLDFPDFDRTLLSLRGKMPGEWERGLLTSVSAALQRRCASVAFNTRCEPPSLGSSNRAEFIGAIMARVGITKAQASAALETVLSSVASALRSGEKVTLFGFGIFSVVTRSARTGRNPRDNKPIKISHKKIPKFKASKKLAEYVNNSPKMHKKK